MDENPYKAPIEHNDSSSDAAIAPRRWPSIVFIVLCAGMAAMCLFTAVVGIVVFVHRLDWNDAAAA